MMPLSVLPRQPRLLQQWVAATLLAMLPLAIAFGYALWSLQRQAQGQHEQLQRAAELGQLDAAMTEQIKELERSARHYVLLGEPTFLESFTYKRAQLAQRKRRIAGLLGKRPSALDELAAALDTAETSLHSEPRRLRDLDAPFDRAYRAAAGLSEIIAAAARVDRARLAASADSTRQRLLLIGALAIPATLLLMVAGSIAVSTPLRRLGRAIRLLGQGQWEQPVAIAGPGDLVQLGERLEWMRQQLLAADRQQQTFARHVTHELKSPLAAIMEGTSLLTDEVPGPLTPGQRQVLRILEDSAGHLQALIQQLLDYNAVAAAIGSDESRAVDLQVLCERIRARLRGLDPAQTLRWQIGGEPRQVRGNPQLLEMILCNLLSNAVHFSPEGGLISVQWGQTVSGWWLSVADEGPGVATAEIGEIFRPFYQGGARQRGPLKGTGMGLAIVRECVNRLGGEITVQPAAGGGAGFRLCFPGSGETP